MKSSLARVLLLSAIFSSITAATIGTRTSDGKPAQGEECETGEYFDDLSLDLSSSPSLFDACTRDTRLYCERRQDASLGGVCVNSSEWKPFVDEPCDFANDGYEFGCRLNAFCQKIPSEVRKHFPSSTDDDGICTTSVWRECRRFGFSASYCDDGIDKEQNFGIFRREKTTTCGLSNLPERFNGVQCTREVQQIEYKSDGTRVFEYQYEFDDQRTASARIEVSIGTSDVMDQCDFVLNGCPCSCDSEFENFYQFSECGRGNSVTCTTSRGDSVKVRACGFVGFTKEMLLEDLLDCSSGWRSGLLSSCCLFLSSVLMLAAVIN